MQPIRRLRLQSVIQKELSRLISRELRDPRILKLSLTSVELSPDAGQATIFVLFLGGEESALKAKECLKGLQSAAPYLKHCLKKLLDIKQTPDLTFKEDKGLENSMRVQELLKKI